MEYMPRILRSASCSVQVGVALMVAIAKVKIVMSIDLFRMSVVVVSWFKFNSLMYGR